MTAAETTYPVSYRVVRRPDDVLLDQWIVSSQMDRPWSPIVTPYIWLNGEMWEGPWRAERRAPGGEWVVIDDSEAAAARWATLRPARV
jgi:hypothetical protein